MVDIQYEVINIMSLLCRHCYDYGPDVEVSRTKSTRPIHLSYQFFREGSLSVHLGPNPWSRDYQMLTRKLLGTRYCLTLTMWSDTIRE